MIGTTIVWYKIAGNINIVHFSRASSIATDVSALLKYLHHEDKI